MAKESNRKFKRRFTAVKASVLALAVAASLLFSLAVSARTAAAQTISGNPIRIAHSVEICTRKYCFLVEQNVIITPSDIQKIKDDEQLKDDDERLSALGDLIIERSVLYMKEPNCYDEKTVITVEDWRKNGGSIKLHQDDLKEIYNKEPENGNPYKLSMDVYVTPMLEDIKAALKSGSGNSKSINNLSKEYSTYSLKNPGIIFVVAATEEDAKKAAEEAQPCEAPKTSSSTAATSDSSAQTTADTTAVPEVKKPKEVKVNEDEDLPEYKTIKMKDRSGGPIEETLKDGEPVTLEWIEPKKKADDADSKGFFDRIPGGLAGLAAFLAVCVGIIAAIIKRRRDDRADY